MSDAGRAETGAEKDRVRHVVRNYLEVFQAVTGCLDIELLAEAVALIRAARDSGSTIFVAGNGGSAAIATHFVNDLGKATKQSGRAPMRVMCLSPTTRGTRGCSPVSWRTSPARETCWS